MPKATVTCIKTRKVLHAPKTRKALHAPDPQPPMVPLLSPTGDNLLSRLVCQAMVAGADPSAVVSPDYELLMLCDELVAIKRQSDALLKAWRAVSASSAHDRAAYEEWRRVERNARRPALRIAKLQALTPAGLFAKAVALRQMGQTATGMGRSLADDLLDSAALRAVLWPMTAGSH